MNTKTLTTNPLLWLSYILLITNCSSSIRIDIGPSDDDIHTTSMLELQNTAAYDEVVLCIGNPDTGASSLLNTIFQKPIFEPYTNLLEEIEQPIQEHIYENKKYVVMPGLSDSNLRQAIALAITTILQKEDKDLKIIFIANATSNQISPQDLATINTICDAIKNDFPYALVIHNTSAAPSAPGDTKAFEIYQTILHKKPTLTTIIQQHPPVGDESTQDGDHAADNRDTLINLIDNLTPATITPATIGTIDITRYDKKVKALTIQIADITLAQPIHTPPTSMGPLVIEGTLTGALTFGIAGVLVGMTTIGGITGIGTLPATTPEALAVGGVVGAGIGATTGAIVVGSGVATVRKLQETCTIL